MKLGVQPELNARLRNRLLSCAALTLLSAFVVPVAGGCRAVDSRRRTPAAKLDSAIVAAVGAPLGAGAAAESRPLATRRPTLPLAALAPDADVARASSVPDGGMGDDGPRPEFTCVEEREPDPRSDMVTIKVQADSPKGAHVYWGPKDLGVTPLEIPRPRSSGPLDLILRAPGYLTVHTRAFTDRNDRIAVHLIPETDAPRVFGYRPR